MRLAIPAFHAGYPSLSAEARESRPVTRREPTAEMRLVAEKMGLADWPGSREIPRYQILTTQDILEHDKGPIIPDSYRIAPHEGVGKASPAEQSGLFGE